MPEPQTQAKILAAAKEALLEVGYASLSTRRIAESAGVPLSQIHYHFGSKQKLVLELLDEENRLLLQRQQHMYGQDVALWKRWEQACDFLEDDITSGYVRVLQEMTAAGWSDAAIAARVRDDVRAWFELLAGVATDAVERLDGASPFTPRELAVLTSTTFLGVESMILLGFTEEDMPMRSALRSVGEMIRRFEDPDAG